MFEYDKMDVSEAIDTNKTGDSSVLFVITGTFS